MQNKRKVAGVVLAVGLGLAGGVPTTYASVNAVSAVQQKGVCKGTVKDMKGQPLIGATVVVKGTTVGTITDMDGNYVLDNVQQGAIIEVSFIGYKTTTQTYNGDKPLEFKLLDESELIDEVVVVGYGTQKKANLSGSVTSVSSEQIQNRPIQNLTSGLQGLMPGVTITGTNGAPGMDNGNIRVRGTGTLNNASPYILIDGIESSTMNALDPNDIENISVLKDASSAAIYGSKAANGVILITTKRGKSEKPTVSYSGYAGIQNLTDLVDRLSSYDYARMYNDALAAEGKSARFSDEILNKFKDGTDPNYPNTDWYGLAYKTGIMHRHNVSVTGGSDAVKYMGALGYLNQTGVLSNASRE